MKIIHRKAVVVVLTMIALGLLSWAIVHRLGQPDDISWQPTGVENTDWQCENGQLLYRYHNGVDGTYSITARIDPDRRCTK